VYDLDLVKPPMAWFVLVLTRLRYRGECTYIRLGRDNDRDRLT
jgi:hypothetical protein